MRRSRSVLLIALLVGLLLLAGLWVVTAVRLEPRREGDAALVALGIDFPAATCVKEFGASFPFVKLGCEPRQLPPTRP